jgi:hypothetical protein
MISSQANHESEALWSPHTADQASRPYAARRQSLSSRYQFRDREPVVYDSAAANVAAAYNQAGGDYVAYADGDPTHLFEFDGPHAYADRRVWTLLDRKLTELRATGASSINILDAGCGPGTSQKGVDAILTVGPLRGRSIEITTAALASRNRAPVLIPVDAAEGMAARGPEP